jgi:Rho GTPase-activating protein 1
VLSLTSAASSLTTLAQHIQVENLLIPSSTYLTDRRISDDIFVPHATGRRAFGARKPFPTSSNGTTRFPRVLRETTSFVLLEENITSEGLFRVPPHSKLRDVMKEAYDRGQKYIIWKDNGVTLPVPPYPNAEHQDEILAEVDPKDAYSVFMAAALIKAWYASLRQPIFPTTSYGDLKRLYGDVQDVPDLNRLKDLFSPSSEWSLLPGISREIVVRHLLPLLHEVAARQAQNKMTAENLAVCFAPGLLCGPDQIEDAKMSSIIRRIFTHAIDLWPNGLRDACEQSVDAFYQELKLPKDEADWDDPVEEKREFEGRDSLEEQTSGITLEDNEKPFEAYPQPYPEVSHDEMPPPLPPRSRIPSTQSSTDSAKRKPAPTLQVAPPRYSTIISDAPEDVAESPVTYAATTDGFAPRRPDDNNTPPPPPRWDEVSDKKSGTRNSTSSTTSTSTLPNIHTSNSPTSTFTTKLNIPKRKTLTAAQVDNIERSVVVPANASPSAPLWKTYDSTARRGSQSPGAMALPGLANLSSLSTNSATTPARVPKRAPPPVPSPTQSGRESPISTTSPPNSDTKPTSAVEFRRPSIPASANRIPTITGLARPVYPSNPTINRPPSKSMSLPVPGPKPRTVSPGLLQRMPSFEARQQPSIERKMLTPNKLNLKKQSVEDLRKLYEERAGTASVLIEAGRWNR